jgi:hypothetical protein
MMFRKYKKYIVFVVIVLLLTFTFFPSINASKIISITNILTPDPEPPITTLYYDEITGYVTLVAINFPLYMEPRVKATYYIIDDGERQTYEEPFKIPEGTHTVEYWSINTYDMEEFHKSAELMLDTTPPTVKIIEPESGKLYLFGSPIMNRKFSETTICIGQVPVEVDADDKDGYGVSRVFFSYSDGETHYDDNSSDGWSDMYSNMYFGDLTVFVSAMDKKGLVSEPVNTTIKVYSFGFFGRN